MEYFVGEIQTNKGALQTAGVKARDDINTIFLMKQMQRISIPSMEKARQTAGFFQRAGWHLRIKNIWSQKLDVLKEGDILYLQFPFIEHSVFLTQIIRKIAAKKVKVVLIIHDLELLRTFRRNDLPLSKRIRLKFEEKDILFYCSHVIVHNRKMADYISQMGVDKNKLIALQIFDYLIPNYDIEKAAERTLSYKEPIIIAGALRPHKAKYAYNLPKNCMFHLYGVGYEETSKENVLYFGSFTPDDLPYRLNGSFGLVWDGDSPESCTGIYGEYLKINNPHKTSLYLASGIPVIIGKEAALAEFIQENECGILIDSLFEISFRLKKMTKSKYEQLKCNAERIGAKLRIGYYTKNAINQCK